MNFAGDGKGQAERAQGPPWHPLNSTHDLYSMGKDGDGQAPLTAKASRDDTIRANDGGYIGLASEY